MDLGLFIQKLKNKDFFLKCAHAHRAFSRINHMLGHKVSLGKFSYIKHLFHPQCYNIRNQLQETEIKHKHLEVKKYATKERMDH